MKTTQADPREANLPKWARDALADTRRRASTAEADAKMLRETQSKSRIWHGEHDAPVYVPDPYGYATVYFELADNPTHTADLGWIKASIRKQTDGKLSVEIMGESSIVIEPTASNVVSIRVKDRH